MPESSDLILQILHILSCQLYAAPDRHVLMLLHLIQPLLQRFIPNIIKRRIFLKKHRSLHSPHHFLRLCIFHLRPHRFSAHPHLPAQTALLSRASVLPPQTALFFRAPASSSSNRISTSSCHLPSRVRKPRGFLPYSINPYFLYSLTAVSFSPTTSSSSCRNPASFAQSMQAPVSAAPIPCPQYSRRILMPKSARCLSFSRVLSAWFPADPTRTPSTNAQISISVRLSFCAASRSFMSSTECVPSSAYVVRKSVSACACVK